MDEEAVSAANEDLQLWKFNNWDTFHYNVRTLPPPDICWRSPTNLRPVLNQGPYPICWAVSSVHCLDYILRQLPDSGVFNTLSSQEVINHFVLKNGANSCKHSPLDIGYSVTEAMKYMKEYSVPTVDTCPYYGLLETFSTDTYTQLKHKCQLRCATKIDEIVALYPDIPYTKETNFWWMIKNYIHKQPIVMGFEVGEQFNKHTGSEPYDLSMEKTNVVSRNAMMCTGYHITTNGVEVWQVQNSHGELWGIGGHGYITALGRYAPKVVSINIPVVFDLYSPKPNNV